MNIWVRTIDGDLHTWTDADNITFDTVLLQVSWRTAVNSFPLVNVIAFSTDTPESGTP